MIENWDRYPNFSRKEFACSHCGDCNTGKAVDISISRADAVRLLRLALMDGRFTGFGIQQKGAKRFIHLDSTTTNRPMIWSY